jgi:hypothetical protein
MIVLGFPRDAISFIVRYHSDIPKDLVLIDRASIIFEHERY